MKLRLIEQACGCCTVRGGGGQTGARCVLVLRCHLHSAGRSQQGQFCTGATHINDFHNQPESARVLYERLYATGRPVGSAGEGATTV